MCWVFDFRWNEVLLSTHEIPSDRNLKSQHKTRIRASAQLKTVLALYEQDIVQKDMRPSYQGMKTMVKTFLDQKMVVASLRPETKEP